MPSRAERLRVLDGLATPDLWPDIRGRETSEGPPEPSPPPLARRLLAAAVALAVAAAGSVVVIRAFLGDEPDRPLAVQGAPRIVFSGGGGDAQVDLFSMNPDGSDLRQLTDTQSSEEQPEPSPDGSRLAFAERQADETTSHVIGVMDADGSNRGEIPGTRLVSGNPVADPVWSPDGSEIAFAAYGDGGGIYVAGASEGPARRLTSAGPPTIHVDSEPEWSPTGDAIAFIRWVIGDSQDSPANEILEVSPSGGDPTLIARFPAPTRERPDDNGEVRGLSWSPDGSQLAFATKGAIFTIDADEGEARELVSCEELGCAEGTDVFTNSTSWSPDGERIAFTAWVNVRSARAEPPLIYIARLTGDQASVTSTGVGGLFPAWQPVPPEGETPTPEPASLPEGTISLPVDAVPEGSILVWTDAGAEVLQAGSERSRLVPGVGTPLGLSPDGSSVLGTTGVSGSPAGELIVVELRSGEGRVLARAEGDDVFGAFARWSPDGSKVAYTVGAPDPAAQSTLCVVSLAVGEPTCFPDVANVLDFDWSPDGQRLVVAAGWSVGILDAATGEFIEIVTPREGNSPIGDALREAGLGTFDQLVGPSWSASGTYLAALARLRDSESAYVPVVFTPDGEFVGFGRASGEFPEPFAWSPAADVLAYTRGEAPYRVADAYLLDPTTGEDRAFISPGDTEDPFVLTDMSWAPSGRWLAIAGWVDRGQGYFETSLAILDPADPSSVRRFPIDSGDASSFLAGWGPDQLTQ